MSFTIIIPARYQSTRLPVKPLQNIGGKPLIEYTYRQAKASLAKQVVIATDHHEIMNVCQSFGAQVVMTDENCPTGSDRVSLAADLLGISHDECIINLQADEPLITNECITKLYQFHAENHFFMSTLYYTNHDKEAFHDPNTVKAVCDHKQQALYFSRSPIPHKEPESFKQHIGIYAYRFSALKVFNQLKRCPIETSESLEQLRALWHGKSIGITSATLKTPPISIDTPSDVNAFKQFLEAKQYDTTT